MSALPGRSSDRYGVVESVEALAFWGAVVLPFLYAPLLITGLRTPAEAAAFFGFVLVNVVLFAIGRDYALE